VRQCDVWQKHYQCPGCDWACGATAAVIRCADGIEYLKGTMIFRPNPDQGSRAVNLSRPNNHMYKSVTSSINLPEITGIFKGSVSWEVRVRKHDVWGLVDSYIPNLPSFFKLVLICKRKSKPYHQRLKRRIMLTEMHWAGLKDNWLIKHALAVAGESELDDVNISAIEATMSVSIRSVTIDEKINIISLTALVH
jgi:hypothetical protein